MSDIIKGETGWVAKGGRYTTDKYGLSTGSYRWEKVSLTGEVGTSPIEAHHPLAVALSLEKATLGVEEGVAFAEGEYAGIVGPAPSPTYELDFSTSDEQIETHPDFATFGTDANGADYDANTGEFTGFTKRPKWDKDNPNYAVDNPEWIGVRSYLCPGCVWREVRISTSADTSIDNIGKIASPPGPVPSAGGGRTWLYSGASMQLRGNVYVSRREWRLSGMRGWNTTIYGA